MSKWIALFALTAAAVSLQILIMIYGWGLNPQSWWWIIGGGLFGVSALRAMMEKVSKELKE